MKKNYNNKNKQTSLHIVCKFPKKKSFQKIKILIDNGANINAKNKSKETPLHYACQFQNKPNSFEIIKYLIENGANINAKTKYHKETPLHYACQFQTQKINLIEIVKLMIEKGIEINTTSTFHGSFLHLICEYQKENAYEVLQILLENGADLNAKDILNNTALHLACQFQKTNNLFEIVKLLVANGADVNAQNESGKTPLHYVFQFQNKLKSSETIKYLIENGADVNIIDDNGKTLLQLICENEIIQTTKNPKISEVIKLLIQKIRNIDLNIEIENDLHQKIPLFYSIYKYDKDLITLLMINNADILILTDKQITKEMIDLFPKIYSINQDLNNLLNSNDNLSDFEIETNDSFKFKVHKQILLLRFDYNQLNLQKFINNCKRKSKEIVEIVINFIYTGFPNFDNLIQKFQVLKELKFKEKENKEDLKKYNEYQKYGYSDDDLLGINHSFYYEKIKENKKIFEELKEKFEKIEKEFENENEINEEFFKEIGFDLNWIKSKSKRKGIIKDLSKLYEENDSKKDFTIIYEDEKEIKVHKLILFLRSELFKGMFQLNIEDKSNQVHDYSRKSFETIQQFIYFLYHDKIEENKLNSKIIEEFEDIKDYFQLNLNSIIDLFLNKENENK